MDHPWRARFLDGLRAAAERGVRIQILVLDPDSKAAEQRSRDLDNQFNVARVISEVLQEFWRLRAGLIDRATGQLEIRVYSLLPPARMYRWDARAMLQLTWLALPMAMVIMILSLGTNLPRYFLERAVGERGLGVYGLAPYWVSGSGPAGLVFGYGSLTQKEVVQGIELLADAVATIRGR